MAQFAILIYAPAPADWTSAPDDELEAHGDFGAVMSDQGVSQLVAYALEPATEAKTARSDQLSDGPAVGSELALGGFGIVEATDIDHAAAVARLNPATWRGAVEVRPLLAGTSD